MHKIALGILAILCLIIFVQWLIFTARRLDKLYRRYGASWRSLENTLNQRALVAQEMGIINDCPETVMLAQNVVNMPQNERHRGENALMQQLVHFDSGNIPSELLAQFNDAHERVIIARRFYDDAVNDIKVLRQMRRVRWFHLAGHSLEPDYFNIAELVQFFSVQCPDQPICDDYKDDHKNDYKVTSNLVMPLTDEVISLSTVQRRTHSIHDPKTASA